MNYETLFLSVKKFLIVVSLSTSLVQANEIVLWNKLGSDHEVLNSEIGHSFNISLVKIDPADPEPGVSYVTGRYGNALATLGGGNYYGGGGRLTMNPDNFFPPDKTKGTVEFWFQKRIQEFIPYRTPLLGIFGSQPYARGDVPSYGSIGAFWSDGFTGYGGLQFAINSSGEIGHYANDLEWNNVPVGKWVHLAFVWDLAGIEGSLDKMRIYRNGNITARNTDSISDIKPDTNEVRILAHHNYAIFGEPTAYMDNIVVWDYAKTNFSHRFTENPLLVNLDSFSVNTLGNQIVIEWKTKTEIDNLGMNLWCAQIQGNQFMEITQLNSKPIFSKAIQLNEEVSYSSTDYPYINTNLKSGVQHCTLEDIDASGQCTLHCDQIDTVVIGEGNKLSSTELNELEAKAIALCNEHKPEGVCLDQLLAPNTP